MGSWRAAGETSRNASDQRVESRRFSSWSMRRRKGLDASGLAPPCPRRKCHSRPLAAIPVAMGHQNPPSRRGRKSLRGSIGRRKRSWPISSACWKRAPTPWRKPWEAQWRRSPRQSALRFTATAAGNPIPGSPSACTCGVPPCPFWRAFAKPRSSESSPRRAPKAVRILRPQLHKPRKRRAEAVEISLRAGPKLPPVAIFNSAILQRRGRVEGRIAAGRRFEEPQGAARA